MADAAPRWKFLTNHAQVLACIANDPGVLLREISERVGITERATALGGSIDVGPRATGLAVRIARPTSS